MLNCCKYLLALPILFTYSKSLNALRHKNIFRTTPQNNDLMFYHGEPWGQSLRSLSIEAAMVAYSSIWRTCLTLNLTLKWCFRKLVVKISVCTRTAVRKKEIKLTNKWNKGEQFQGTLSNEANQPNDKIFPTIPS